MAKYGGVLFNSLNLATFYLYNLQVVETMVRRRWQQSLVIGPSLRVRVDDGLSSFRGVISGRLTSSVRRSSARASNISSSALASDIASIVERPLLPEIQMN